MSTGEQLFMIPFGVFVIFFFPLAFKQGMHRTRVFRQQGLTAANQDTGHPRRLSRRATMMCAVLAIAWVVGSVASFA